MAPYYQLETRDPRVHVYLPSRYGDHHQIGRHSPPHAYALIRLHTTDDDPTQPKRPHLNPVLMSDMTHIRYDFRKHPRDGIPQSTYQQIGPQPLITHLTDICIISKAFPWSANIRATGSAVTCSDIFEGLYRMLQASITDSEWGIVVTEQTKQETIEKAARARQERDRGNRLKRIDWLGETTVFKGLERDEEFQKKRLLPGMQACKETWVVKFGKP